MYLFGFINKQPLKCIQLLIILICAISLKIISKEREFFHVKKAWHQNMSSIFDEKKYKKIKFMMRSNKNYEDCFALKHPIQTRNLIFFFIWQNNIYAILNLNAINLHFWLAPCILPSEIWEITRFVSRILVFSFDAIPRLTPTY